MSGKADKILLVQLYSNGDCLYATAVARQIKEDYTGCHLTWAIASFCKNIIANNPYVDEVMEVDIKKNDVVAFRRFRRKVIQQKREGVFDEVFIVHNIDTNNAYYDGCIRSSILRAYPNPITVPVTPVLQLTAEEVEKSDAFADKHQLGNYKNVILFEFAPQSGQLKITKEIAVRIAEAVVVSSDTAIILSSANKIVHPNKAIIDGSILTLRETAALSHHCTLLLGCSSGITWITTSTAANLLPMVQIFNPHTVWVNPISRDFERYNLPVEKVIELTDFDETKIVNCVVEATKDFQSARKRFNQSIPLQFKTTRNIVYNLLCYLEFGAIIKHIKVNRRMYGDHPSFYMNFLLGILTFPFKLIKNVITKNVLKKSSY